MMKTLVRYTPKSIGALENFDRMIDSLFRTNTETVYRPAVDIREEEDRYLLEAELPGHTEGDVDVKLDENLLTISTKNDEKHEEKRDGYLLRERRFRSFTRSFVLPRDVDREHIDANFSNGLLTLELKKSPEAKPRQIEVKQAK
jgi:HSP20 family protein